MASDTNESVRGPNPVAFEDQMIEKLRKSKIIEHVFIGDALDSVDMSTLLSLMRAPVKLELSSDGLVFTNEQNEKEECPDYGINISADGMWLSNKIPDVNFDIEQNGNLRRAEEAQSAYCCIIVSKVLNDNDLDSELEEVIKNYNYNEMNPAPEFMSFRSLLEEWLSYQSTTINIAVSAAKYKIVNLKKESAKFLRDGVEEKSVRELQNLSDSIKAINRRYSLGELSQENVKTLSKIQILKLLDARDDEINDRIERSGVETLYRIMNLSSEYISPIVKRRIFKAAEASVNALFEEDPSYETIIGDRQTIVDRWKKRYIKLAKISLRKTEVVKYLKTPGDYVLPRKL